MKRLSIIVLVLGIALAFSGCQKENLLAPDKHDQATMSLKAEKIPFTGECHPTGIVIDEGTTTVLANGNILMMGQITVWCESSDDTDLVVGRSIWDVNSLTYPDGTVHFWGKADILVGGDCYDPEGAYDGKWRLSFHGDGDFNVPEIIVYANGVGKEGNVKGMVGKWTYTFDFGGYFYNTEGYIQ